MQYACFHGTRTSKVWDSYVIFMELKISFRYKQRLKDMRYPKQCLFYKLLVKCLLCIRLIREESRRTPVIWWRWIKQQLGEKGNVQRVLVWLTRLGSPGLTPLLSWVLLLRVGEILKVKLLEVWRQKERRLEYPAHVWMSYKFLMYRRLVKDIVLGNYG